MKKIYLLACILAISTLSARAQSSFTTIEFDKQMQPSLVLEIPNTPDDVEGTILQKLKEKGFNPETKGHLFWKKNKVDGFYVFNDIVLPSVSARTLDLYFKVERKSRREKDKSTVHLLLGTGNNTFVSPLTDSALWSSGQQFLNSFVSKTTAYSLEQEILQQENNLKASRDKLTNMQKDERDLAEKVRRYQDDIRVNQSKQTEQQREIENQAKLLADLKLKRKA